MTATPGNRDPTMSDGHRGTTVQPDDDCPRCGNTVESRSYGVACESHRCTWHEYRTTLP